MEKLIVSAAVNGASRSRTETPHVPLTPGEIAASAVEAHRAGAAIAHVHVRDAEGASSSDPELFRQVMDAVRAECDVVLNFSTDLRLDGGSDSLALRPELASLPVGSVNLGDELMAAPRPRVTEVARRMVEAGVRPELEIFHDGMLGAARELAAAGALPEPVFCQFCLGFEGGAPADAATLARFVQMTPPGWQWALAVEAEDGLGLLALAIGIGGHVRVGIEDSAYYLPGRLAESNAQLVARVVRLAAELGRPVASADEAREILRLDPVAFAQGQT